MSSMITLSRWSSFEMAHRLVDAKTTQCNDTIHGHSYKWKLTVTQEHTVTPNGMVLDYGEMNGWMKLIDEIFDHALWLPTYDAVELYKKHNKKLLWLNDFNPTAENMTLLILVGMLKTFPLRILDGLYSMEVTLKETEDSECSMIVTQKDFDFLSRTNYGAFDLHNWRK